MAVLSKMIWCCFGNAEEELADIQEPLINQAQTDVQYRDKPSTAEVASDIVNKLFAAEDNDEALQADLQSMVHTCGWYDKLAAAILAATERAIDAGKEMGPAAKAAYEKAVAAINEVEEWANANPEMAAAITTLLAFGILAVMMPWLMAYLGFAEEGIAKGSLAAIWQARYSGFVPKGSLFSYLQRLGTKIGRKWYGQVK